jgi:hypothetical protein
VTCFPFRVNSSAAVSSISMTLGAPDSGLGDPTELAEGVGAEVRPEVAGVAALRAADGPVGTIEPRASPGRSVGVRLAEGVIVGVVTAPLRHAIKELMTKTVSMTKNGGAIFECMQAIVADVPPTDLAPHRSPRRVPVVIHGRVDDEDHAGPRPVVRPGRCRRGRLGARPNKGLRPKIAEIRP